MTSIVYPRPVTKNIYDIVTSTFTDKNFVKINTLKENTCIYDSFLLDTYKNYQEESDPSKLNKIREDFIREFKEYLIADSEMSDQFIYNKIFSAYETLEIKDVYMLKSLSDNFDIFELVIVKKNISEDQDRLRGYKLFPSRIKKYFSSVSNFFNLISLDFLKEIIQQRITRKSYLDKMKRLQLKEENTEEIEEILEFMDRKENNLDILSIYNSINLEDCEDQDLILKLLSDTLNINIFLCRAWNTEITVLKDFYKTEENPYIIIFKGEGKTSITGLNTGKYYEAGGIKTQEGIKTILNGKEKEIILDLKKISVNDVDSYLIDRYTKYLKKIEQKSNLDNLEDYYEETSSEESSNESSEDEMEEEKPIVNPDIPAFIRGYTKPELETLLHLFVNPDYDYSDVKKEDLELQYKNYLESKNDD